MRAAARAAQCPPSAAPRRVRGEVAPARPGSLAIRGGSARPGLEPGPRRVAAMLATRLSRQPIHLQITQIARKHVAARARCRARERSPKARRSTHERETRGAGTDCDSALAHANSSVAGRTTQTFRKRGVFRTTCGFLTCGTHNDPKQRASAPLEVMEATNGPSPAVTSTTPSAAPNWRGGSHTSLPGELNLTLKSAQGEHVSHPARWAGSQVCTC